MFAWKMMLSSKVNALQFLVVDRSTGKAAPADLPRWLTEQQRERMGQEPEMMREFAHFLRGRYERNGQVTSRTRSATGGAE